jgi:Tol biopolymer transport system component
LRLIAAPGARNDADNHQLWMFELARGLASRFPTDRSGGAFFPVWSPDGTRIVFGSNRSGKLNLYQRLSNGGGEDELLFKSDEDVTPLSWSPDGRFLGVGASAEQRTQFGIRLDSNGQPAGKPVVFVRRGLGLGIEFSPDAVGSPRWVAYQSTRDGSTEVYLREFDPDSPTLTPAHGAEWQVSKGGGTSPRWNPNGRELFYLAPDRTVMTVDLTGNPNAPTGLPKPLFKAAGIERASQAQVATFSWAVSPDGKRFLFPIPVDSGTSNPPLTVVLNWTSLLAK